MTMIIRCSFLLLLFEAAMAKVSTACYGSPGIGGCTDHRLICTEPLVISITNITFGYRQGCTLAGMANCANTTCCKEETNDCFTPYNQTLLSQLQQICSGRSTFTLNRDNGLNERSLSCFNGILIYHSYSKIEYQCVTNASSSTSQPTSFIKSSTSSSTKLSSTASTSFTNTHELTTSTIRSTTTASSSTSQPTFIKSSATSSTKLSSTDSTSFTNTHDLTTSTIRSTSTGPTTDTKNTSATDVGDIVGGVVGVILVIAIVGAVIFFIKRRKADKKPPKDVHINPNGSNRQYQTDTTSPRTTATPVYYELEKSISNTSRPASARPTSGDNYDYLGGDNHCKNSTGNDNYNHIGISGVTSDDEYHHLKGPNSNMLSVPDSNYNHIGSFSTAEDNYQHIGDDKTRIITDDTYNHIDGHDNTALDSDDYHHIGSSHEHQVVTDGTYNHIGGDHNEILGNDDYHHIGNGNTQPIITDGEYSHIGGADA